MGLIYMQRGVTERKWPSWPSSLYSSKLSLFRQCSWLCYCTSFIEELRQIKMIACTLKPFFKIKFICMIILDFDFFKNTVTMCQVLSWVWQGTEEAVTTFSGLRVVSSRQAVQRELQERACQVLSERLTG